jgi:NAD-dependent deacetylase
MTPPQIKDFQRIVFFTGAGMSAESGIPTYRGQGGVWTQYDWQEYACQEAFLRDPAKVWDFHDVRRAAVSACAPNPGHHAIAQVQRDKPTTAVVTQNIDGLHQAAGAPSVVELHGSLWRVRCDAEGTIREDRSSPIAGRRCACGAYLRPDIVWFGDSLDPRNVQRAVKALEGCDLLVSVGTSGVVYPAAELPRRAMAKGAVTVEINPEDTPVSDLYQHRLRGKASEMLALMMAG